MEASGQTAQKIERIQTSGPQKCITKLVQRRGLDQGLGLDRRTERDLLPIPTTYEIRRTPIPKTDGTMRYINDPGVPWRCYLFLWNIMMVYFLNPGINKRQHVANLGSIYDITYYIKTNNNKYFLNKSNKYKK